MATVSLGSVFFGSPSFTATGAWVETFRIGPRIYEVGHPDAAGVHGVGFKRFGFRERHLSFQCWYVDSGETSAIDTVSSDMDTLANSTFLTTVGTTGFETCELDDANTSFAEPHKCNGSFFLVIATFAVIQRGLV